MSVAPLPRTRDGGLKHREGPRGPALPHVARCGYRSPRSPPPWSSSHRDAVVHFRKQQALGGRWNPSCWGRHRPGPSETHRGPGTGELVWCEAVALGRSFSVDDIHDSMPRTFVVGARYIEWVVAA
jgi:hypothetical protein